MFSVCSSVAGERLLQPSLGGSFVSPHLTGWKNRGHKKRILSGCTLGRLRVATRMRAPQLSSGAPEDKAAVAEEPEPGLAS